MKKIIFDPGLDEREKDGYYYMEARCSNCDDPDGGGYKNDIDVMIPDGQKVPKKKFKCPNCKTKNLTIS